MSQLQKITVLCARRKSIYREFGDSVDIWDKKRDAFKFNGTNRVIAHPPCRLWASLEQFAKPENKERERELGRRCARIVIENGGILEHPFKSRLFCDMGLPIGGCVNDLGFTIEIPQRMFGHTMIKNTWLFCSKMALADFPKIAPTLSGPLKPISSLSKRQRESTPVALAKWLIDANRIAETIG